MLSKTETRGQHSKNEASRNVQEKFALAKRENVLYGAISRHCSCTTRFRVKSVAPQLHCIVLYFTRENVFYGTCHIATGFMYHTISNQIGWLSNYPLLRYTSSRDHFDFFDLFFNFFEEERITILAFLGFEPTHLCDPSDQRRL